MEGMIFVMHFFGFYPYPDERILRKMGWLLWEGSVQIRRSSVEVDAKCTSFFR